MQITDDMMNAQNARLTEGIDELSKMIDAMPSAEQLKARIASLETELERAYRALVGYQSGRLNDAARAYHALTVAAAKRFVFEDALDGSEYFIGKPVEVLHAALRLPA